MILSKKLLVFVCILSLLLSACSLQVGQISSFKLEKIELSDKPSFGAIYKLTGTDEKNKKVIAYSTSLGKSYRTGALSELGICYTLIGTEIEGEVPSVFRITSSYPVTCKQN